MIDEVTNMAKSQAARASILERVRYELTHLSYADQIRVVEELIGNLNACLRLARTRKLEPVDHFAKLRKEPPKLLKPPGA